MVRVYRTAARLVWTIYFLGKALHDAGKRLSSLTRIMHEYAKDEITAVFVESSQRVTPGHLSDKPKMASVYDVNEDVEKALGVLVEHGYAEFVNGWYLTWTCDCLSVEATTDEGKAIQTVCQMVQDHGIELVRFVPEYASV